MGIQAGVGMSHHRNPRVAGQEAVQQALEAAGIEQPDFCFVFATVGYEQQELLKAVREATGGAPLCGCSGEGVIAEGEADESSFAVGVMAIRSDQLRFSHGIVTGLQEDPYPARTDKPSAGSAAPLGVHTRYSAPKESCQPVFQLLTMGSRFRLQGGSSSTQSK